MKSKFLITDCIYLHGICILEHKFLYVGMICMCSYWYDLYDHQFHVHSVSRYDLYTCGCKSLQCIAIGTITSINWCSEISCSLGCPIIFVTKHNLSAKLNWLYNPLPFLRNKMMFTYNFWRKFLTTQNLLPKFWHVYKYIIMSNLFHLLIHRFLYYLSVHGKSLFIIMDPIHCTKLK